MSDAMIERLREDMAELRWQITAQAAEIAVLRDECGRLQTKAALAVDATRDAEAEVARLRALTPPDTEGRG